MWQRQHTILRKIAAAGSNSALSRALRALGRIEPGFGAEPVDGSLVHWNTTYLDRAVQHLRAQGVVISNELLSHVAPLGGAHRAHGRVRLERGEPTNGLRPLRDVPTAFLLRAA